MAERSLQTRAHSKQRPRDAAEITFAGERVVLTGSRAAIWTRTRTAIISDIHLGKADCLAVVGAPIPAGTVESQVLALDALVERFAIERLVVVGDLLHAGVGLTPLVRDAVRAWRLRTPIPLLVVPGNHDRAIERVAEEWLLTLCPPRHAEGPFDFVHDPRDCSNPPDRPTFAGHIHPAILLRGGGDALRLPCFHLRRNLCTLPAFSPFTAGVSVHPGPDDRTFAVADGEVIEI